MHEALKTPSAEKVSLFDSKYVKGNQYDYPTKIRPKFGEVVQGTDGIRYTAYKGDDGRIASRGDKLVLMQTSGGWFTAIPASEVPQEYNKKTADFQKDCMVFVPQE